MMKMKKLITIAMLWLGITMCATAQIQQGYVKTKGRLGANGQVIAGKRLSGVTVQIKGRSAVMSQANGTFSFPIPANKFLILSVKKQGYVLADPETTTRQYSYSFNPLVLVMETQEQQAEDKLANERKIRRNLQRQLQAKEEEIEALKEQNKITREEYQQRLQRLYADLESNEKLISEMAERYSRLDYDQMDEFNLRISDCILNGRLTEADSLLRSKGDINDRIAHLNQHHNANLQAQETLDKSKAMEQKDLEDIAQDCYHYYETFMMNHQNDSAAHYMELRANLDTTNINWQYNAGVFSNRYQANYTLSMKYLLRGSNIAKTKHEEQSAWDSMFSNAIGDVYKDQAIYPQALENYLKAMKIWEHLLGENHPNIAISCNNIGYIHIQQGNLDKALEYHLRALDIYTQQHELQQGNIASTYYLIGHVYRYKRDYNKAMEYYTKALTIWEQMTDDQQENISLGYNAIASIYFDQDICDKAIEYYHKALNIQQKVVGNNHPHTATTCENIGMGYLKLGNYDKALEYLFKALDIQKLILRKGHPSIGIFIHIEELNILEQSPYVQYVFATYCRIADIYSQQGNNEESLKYYLKALPIWEEISGKEDSNTAAIYNAIGVAYHLNGNTEKSLEYLFKSLAIFEKLYGENNQYTNTLIADIGEAYFSLGDYQKALDYCSKAYNYLVDDPEIEVSDIEKLKEMIDKSRAQLGL